MKNRWRALCLAIGILLGVAGGVSVQSAGVAHAQVTNCMGITATWPGTFNGKCTSTTANPPYTTQFAIVGPCVGSGSTIWVTSGWYNVGPTVRHAYCPAGYTVKLVDDSPYYLFR